MINSKNLTKGIIGIIVKVLTLDDFDLKGKTVFLRVDMNCPIDSNTMEISGTKRIEEAIETIKALGESKLVIASHQGRVGNVGKIFLRNIQGWAV